MDPIPGEGADIPTPARRIRRERLARNWSQAEAVRAMEAHSRKQLADRETLLRNWKRWEAGSTEPNLFYKSLIAQTFGTVTNALFPPPRIAGDAQHVDTGMATLDLIARLRASDVSTYTLEALAVTTDRLCSDYPHLPSQRLVVQGREWLRRITDLLDKRLTLTQHREVLHLAGQVALLVGCVEHDMGDRPAAEGSRQAALSLGQESGATDVVGWAHEMRAWFSLTQGDYRGMIQASDLGLAAAGGQSVAVQLLAQKAKAWARIGDRRQAEVALDQGRRLLESLPHPDNLDHHFVVDPAKYDFYAMDCYRLLGEDQLAESYASEILSAGTDASGWERSPMRNAEARITLGVVAARRGDVEQAVHQGSTALLGERKSVPSLALCSRELAGLLSQRYARTPATEAYQEQLRTLTAPAA